MESSYDENDLSLYALSVGAARDPLDKDELKFVYELGGNFQALPTYGVMPQIGAMLKAAKEGALALPGMNFGFDRLLHGEQYTEIKRPLPPHAKLKHTFKFKKALDKDPNAVVTFAITSTDENGNEVAYNEMTSFVKDAGGWGGERGDSGEINVPPAREPDAVIEEKTDANQTLLYRLCGDWNPLHADPAFARAFGYDKPILHGLCTFGYAGRHVIKAFSNNDGRYFKSIKVRFAKTVFPGETLETRMWKESDNRIVFETWVKERNEVVLKNAAIELFSEIPAEAPVPEQVSAEEVSAPQVEQKPELVDQTGTSFQFEFSNPDQQFFIDLKNAPGVAGPGTIDKPDVTLALDSEHLATVFGGDLAAVQKLFFGGDLKIGGNVMASNKLTVLQDMDPKLVEQARDKRLASGQPDTATAQPKKQKAPQAEKVLPELAEKLSAIGGQGGVLQIKVRSPDSAWFIDLSASSPGIVSGEKDAAAVITLDDSKLADLIAGKVALSTLYQKGDMRVDGDLALVRKLEQIL